MPIIFVCPSCTVKMQIPDVAGGRQTKCPKCGIVLVVPKPDTEEFPFATTPEASTPQLTGELPCKKPIPNTIPAFRQLDAHTKIAVLLTILGLSVLSLSPLFPWINFAGGGQIGLKGDGKIVLGITLITIAIYIAVLIKPKWFKTGVIAVQIWGTVAIYWMVAHIWKVSSIADSSDVKNNPFAVLIATQISPGTGLYLGLISALVVTVTLGFIALRRSVGFNSLGSYFAGQGISLVICIFLAIYVDPLNTSKPLTTKSNTPDPSNPIWDFNNETTNNQIKEENELRERSLTMRKKINDDQSKWKQTNHVSEKDWQDLIANYKYRKQPKNVYEIDWWKEAENKTPSELNELYPPKQPKEWYQAEWHRNPYFRSNERELDYSIDGKKQKLKIKVLVRTEPNLPIKELHGKLAFIKNNEVIYETQIIEKPDVSFTDIHFVHLLIAYDDNNPNHRTLRFTKDEELTPVFTVHKVVFADGTEKTFE